MVALILCFRKLKVRGVISDVLIQKQETSTWAAELVEVKKNGIAMEWQLLTEKKGQKTEEKVPRKGGANSLQGDLYSGQTLNAINYSNVS